MLLKQITIYWSENRHKKVFATVEELIELAMELYKEENQVQ